MYQGTTEKQCTQCGATFRGGTNQTCNPCRTTDRECVACGKQFRGRDRKCYECKAIDRSCEICGKVFHGITRTCEECRGTDRPCKTCGRQFVGIKNICPACSAIERECKTCGRTFRSTALTCPQCTATDRDCAVCGKTFHGYQTVCRSCHVTDRTCASCRRTFRGDQHECSACRTTERQCITCGTTFRAAGYLECLTCSGRSNVYNAARRIRRLAAQIDGPLPRAVYRAILASGSCVYCDEPATCLDHVRPLARGGEETAGNLVPACHDSNRRKSARLLIHWDPVRVAHGAARSAVVAAELERERASFGDYVLRPPNAV